MKLFLDLETFSPTDISCGVHRYAEDVEILLFAYAFENEPAKVVDFTAHEELPQRVLDAFSDPSVELWAHNSHFDRTVLKRFYPEVSDPRRWRDTMILAYAHSLPGSLGQLSEILGLPVDQAKDKDGHRLVLLFCKPQPEYRKIRRATALTHPEDWEHFCEYCRLDVEAMRAVWRNLPHWNETAYQLWQEWAIDQNINDRGMAIDMDLVKAAIKAADADKSRADNDVYRMTDGAVTSTGQRDELLKHILSTYGVTLPDMQKSTLERRLNDENLPLEVRELIAIRLQSTKTSVQKFKALANATNSDGRLRGCLQYMGATRTGRWCLTGDHEVLTPDGWVRFDEWKGGRIAMWNASDCRIIFSHAMKVSFDYDGEMVITESQRISQVATPDHKMPVWDKKSECYRAIEIAKACKTRFDMPFHGRHDLSEDSIPEDQARVLIMTQADGFYQKNGNVGYHFKKERKVLRCEENLRSAGVVYRKYVYPNSTIIEVPKAFVPDWLKSFSDKTFGCWILRMPPDVLFEELAHWDSSRPTENSIQYSTTNKTNADWIQAAAHLSGRAAVILPRPCRKTNWNVCYAVNIWLTPGKNHSVRREYNRTEPFCGKVYCAATSTGFFLVRRNGKVWITGNTGRNFQPQNLVRGTMKPAQVEEAIGAIKSGVVDLLYDDVPQALSNCIRGAIVAPPGKKLVVADLSNIEGRVLAWLAGEEWKLEAFRAYDRGEGPDLYKATYGRTFGVNPNDVTKQQRQIGKVLELAMGYQGGVGAFLNFARIYRVDLDELAVHTHQAIEPRFWNEAEESYDWFCEKGLTFDLNRETFIACEAIKRAWRSAHPAIVKFWSAVDVGCRRMYEGGPVAKAGKVMLGRKSKGYGAVLLPSGRYMCYPAPRAPRDGERATFVYRGVNQYTRKWSDIKSYGGKCVENLTQATARDVLASAIPAIEAAGYKIVLSVHDELITETPDSPEFSVEQLSSFMATPPAWAPDLPLSAAGFEGKRYRKD